MLEILADDLPKRMPNNNVSIHTVYFVRLKCRGGEFNRGTTKKQAITSANDNYSGYFNWKSSFPHHSRGFWGARLFSHHTAEEFQGTWHRLIWCSGNHKTRFDRPDRRLLRRGGSCRAGAAWSSSKSTRMLRYKPWPQCIPMDLE